MEIINYDVLIPARDEENNIKKTLESINNQTIKPNSVIVVNEIKLKNKIMTFIIFVFETKEYFIKYEKNNVTKIKFV